RLSFSWRKGAVDVKRQLSAAVPSLARLLYTQNPFYLIGRLLVLYGLQQSLGRDPTLVARSLLVGLLAGSALLLAGVVALVLRSMNYYSVYGDLAWALFAFPLAAAIALLALLPAARTPPWKEPKTGTPWKWPYYPWSLFIFLTLGVAIRAWWLTIAFEPAKG